jgi:hypothetical protein
MLYHRGAIVNRYWLPILSVMLLLTSGCELVDRFNPVPIENVLANPRDYEGRNITISGKVTDSVSFLVIKAFLLTDSTGQIFVVTDRIIPQKGTQLKVTGTIVETFSLGDQTLTVFKEQSLQP